MRNFFSPRPGRFGTQTLVVTSGTIGGTNFAGGASPLTANAATTFRMPSPPVKCRFKSLAVSTVTVPADSDGTIVAVANKYNGSAVAQTANVDLEALTTRQLLVTNGNASEPNRIFNGTTDVLEIVVTSNSAAIDTQPAGLIFTATFEVLA